MRWIPPVLERNDANLKNLTHIWVDTSPEKAGRSPAAREGRSSREKETDQVHLMFVPIVRVIPHTVYQPPYGLARVVHYQTHLSSTKSYLKFVPFVRVIPH